MRSLAGLAIVFGVLGCAGGASAASALARPAMADGGAALLMNAAFSDASTFDASAKDGDPIGALLDRDTARPGVGPTAWTSSEVSLGATRDGSAVNGLRVSVGGALRGPDGRPLLLAPLNRAELEPQSYEVALTRDWPGAVRLSSGRYDLDLTPHAGLGMTSLGGSAEAGATLTLGQKSREESLKAQLGQMGVQDGASLGDAGRWYIYAAASGRAVGLSMLREQGGWDRAWAQDSASTLISDAQLGVGWRKGAMQTSFGYMHRAVKGEHMLMGQEAKDDSVVAFSLSIKPRR
jgi:hypothetical protein